MPRSIYTNESLLVLDRPETFFPPWLELLFVDLEPGLLELLDTFFGPRPDTADAPLRPHKDPLLLSPS